MASNNSTTPKTIEATVRQIQSRLEALLENEAHSRACPSAAYDRLASAGDALVEAVTAALSEAARDDDSASDGVGIKNVLLVEDNPVNRMVAEGMLRQFQCDVDVAENGAEAVSRFQEAEYDLIFMDCQMPVMDGFEAVSKIREIEESTMIGRIPIVALTANALKGDRERCMSAGMDDYVTKPFSLADLRGALERQGNKAAATPLTNLAHTDSSQA